MNRQSSERLKNICHYVLHALMAIFGVSLLGLFIANVVLFSQIPVCGNRDGMVGWVLITHNCYTVVDNVTFYELIVHCAKHEAVVPNALERNEVLVVSSILGIDDYWLPFTRKRNGWFHGKLSVNVKGDPDNRQRLGKPRIASASEECAIYYNGIVEEICTKKHKGICLAQF